jgi:hypothetical protein
MKKLARTAVWAVGVAVVSAMAMPVLARADDLPPSLRSFAEAQAASAYELSPGAGFSLRANSAASLTSVSSLPLAVRNDAFVISTPLSPNLSLDSGRRLDVATRFTNYDGAAQPFLSPVNAPYLALANGGRYTGVTFVPASNLKMRLGASINSERLDRFNFDPIAPSGPLALSYDASQSRSILGGVSWDITSAIGFDVTAISSERSGVPLGFANASIIAPRARTDAFSIAAHADIGSGWVTTAAFSQGMTQLDRKGASGTSMVREQSYSLAIAKHGLFSGDDALGIAFTRPAPSMAGSFASLMGSGDAPSLVVAQSPALGVGRVAQENDISVGYITNFLDGAVALQTNAAYQTNAQGQRGATGVSLLSRAKIKF